MNIIGWWCAACEAELPIWQVFPWVCPNSTPTDRHHVLQAVGANVPVAPASLHDDPNPFVTYDSGLAWAAFAQSHGMSLTERMNLVRDLDAAVARVAGTGFRVTPFGRNDALSDALGFAATGGVWVKDEACDVAGSQKARHLFSIMLHLRAAELLGLAPWASAAQRPLLAIASCGNAAIAASTLAAAVDWPIAVFVPPWASDSVRAQLDRLGADVRVSPRRYAEPPGDPCIIRFREFVASGAIPFSVQGTENALCLDGGRTIGWEMLAQAADLDVALDRVFIQTGGGAFATSVGAALQSVMPRARLHPVQVDRCSPLAGAWGRAQQLPGGPSTAAHHWAECMRVWGTDGEPFPESAADGILDDETYDWVGIFEAMIATGGSPVVCTEELIEQAHQAGVSLTGIDATATATAGLAGLLEMRSRVADSENVGIIISGIARH